MATQFSLWVAKEVLDQINLKSQWTPAYSVMYLGLATASTNLRNNLITDEVSTTSTGYARVQVGVGSSYPWGVADSAGKSFISGTVLFPDATASWGTITTVFTIDASAGAGNVYHIIDLTTPKLIEAGNTPRFLDTQLWIGM